MKMVNGLSRDYWLYWIATASASAIPPGLVPPEKLKDAISVSKVDDGVVVVACPMLAALPALMTVVLITLLDCMTIAEAMPMQMCFSIMMQTRVSKELLGRVASVSAGQLL